VQLREDADEHEAILAAVLRGRPREAETLTRRHVAAAIRRSAL
jgi:DNA-binding GntR family transcriptional regulator